MNIWIINCAQATAFIFDSGTDDFETMSKYMRNKMCRPRGTWIPTYGFILNSRMDVLAKVPKYLRQKCIDPFELPGQTFTILCWGTLALVVSIFVFVKLTFECQLCKGNGIFYDLIFESFFEAFETENVSNQGDLNPQSSDSCRRYRRYSLSPREKCNVTAIKTGNEVSLDNHATNIIINWSCGYTDLISLID